MGQGASGSAPPPHSV
ncbi:hypothetical protein NGA_0188301, partial [Nannochloropsis gaditana CCMP526]